MPVTISIDAMGGDVGLQATVPAALSMLSLNPELKVILVGSAEEIERALALNHAKPNERLRIVHTTQTVLMDESPQSALKNKKDSSMRVAINLVKQGEADACVSAGNTGALMATARFVLKTLPGIDRPAIATFLPNMHGETCMLDLGANADCTAEHLLQFGIMGAMLVSALSGKAFPSVGLLNIGSEETKGNEVVKEAGLLLKKSHLNFYGNVEGDDIFHGTTDVVVCDGFVGNVALKTSEGLARMFVDNLRREFKQNWLRRLCAVLSYPVLKAFKRKLDPKRYNGATFIGLKGIVIKSHGGADQVAFQYAILKAIAEAQNDIINKITLQLTIEFGQNERHAELHPHLAEQ